MLVFCFRLHPNIPKHLRSFFRNTTGTTIELRRATLRSALTLYSSRAAAAAGAAAVAILERGQGAVLSVLEYNSPTLPGRHYEYY